MDSIDVLQLHSRVSIERDSKNWSGSISLNDVLGKDGVADALDSIRDTGFTNFIGFTGLGDTQALHKIIESGRFDVVQAYFNILNPSSGLDVPKGFKGYDFSRLIDKAASFGVGVAAIRVMAAGALGGIEARKGYAAPFVRGPMVPNAIYNDDEIRGKMLNFLVSCDARSIPEAAIRFVLMHSGISVVLIGFSTLSQIEEAAACSGKGPLPTSFIEQLGRVWSS
jgi:aryl-alcohol dehydrogenase-like predicted oxidoreductase